MRIQSVLLCDVVELEVVRVAGVSVLEVQLVGIEAVQGRVKVVQLCALIEVEVGVTLVQARVVAFVAEFLVKGGHRGEVIVR